MFELIEGVLIGCGLIALGYIVIVVIGLLTVLPAFAIFTVHEWIVEGDTHELSSY